VTKCTMDTPEVRQALQFMLDLERKHKVSPSFAEIEGSEKLRGELGMFMSGRVAMFFPSSWAIPTLNMIKAFQWDVASFPRVKGGRRRAAIDPGLLCISTQTKHVKEAWEFVRFAGGKEGQRYFGKLSIPALKEVAYSNFCTPPPANVRVIVHQIEEVVRLNLFRRTWSIEFYDTVYKIELDKLFLGHQTIGETVEKISSGASKFLEKE